MTQAMHTGTAQFPRLIRSCRGLWSSSFYMRIATAFLVCHLAASLCLAGWMDDIGYTSLQARLGGATPDGTGIAVTQVEAPSGSNYMPNVTLAEFTGKTITAESGTSGVSSHATTVADYYYGAINSSGTQTSIAPGINTVDVYEANNWLTSFLNIGTFTGPLVETRRTESHSWIGSLGSTSLDTQGLQRLDLMIDRDGVVVCAAVNNGAGTTMPTLLPSAYNVITVGLTSANSSYGPTTIDGAGRVKPDIVAPASATSWATPIVASSAALLLQTADAGNILSSVPPATRPTAKALLVKALLMAGATKAPCAGWRKGFATPATDGSVPLDYRYGAGQVNIDNSDRILTAGQQPASSSVDVGLTGWDYGNAASGSPSQYFFVIPDGFYANRASILAAWNRHISVSTNNKTYYNLTPSLANLDAQLYQASGYTATTLVDQSVSTVDNIEHIYQTNLPAGRYVFQVITNQAWPYAVAWDIATVPVAPASPDPADGAIHVLLASGSETLSWNGGAGTPGVSFDVYLDTVNPPSAKVASEQSPATYAATGLSHSTTYYWQIVAGSAGGQTSGPIWSFTTTIAGDIDGDGAVILADLKLLVAAWNSTPTSPNWNPYADIDADSAVNLADLKILVAHWNQSI